MYIEVDMDGVTLDIHRPLAEELKKIVPSFELSWIETWSMEELPSPLRDRAQQLFADPAFIGSLKPYPGAVAALERLKGAGHNLFINTSVSSPACTGPRLGTIAEHIAHVIDSVQVTTFPSKPMLENVHATIDDHIGNLHKSHAKIRILVTQHHNRFVSAEHVKWCTNPWNNNIKRADSLADAVSYILKLQEA